jgi:hypothetical protein
MERMECVSASNQQSMDAEQAHFTALEIILTKPSKVNDKLLILAVAILSFNQNIHFH